MTKTVEGLQINEDRAHQRREWRIERVGWGVMGLLLLAGLLGLLGYGPLSRAHGGQSGTFSVEYDRLQRAKAPTGYHFEVDPALARDGVLRVRFEDTLLEEVELVTVIPEPESVRTGAGYFEYAFAVGRGNRPARITFEFEPTTFGSVSGRVAVPGAAPVAIDQFVFP